MQPTLIITAPVEGMVSINGRFIGEVRADLPLMVPVAPFGAVYLEFRPLAPGFLPMARRVVMSGGTPMAQGLADGLFAVLWPGNISEIELSPEQLPEESPEALMIEDMPCRIVRGRTTRLHLGSSIFELPHGARTPGVRQINGMIALAGSCDGGQYLLLLSHDGRRQAGFLHADRLEWESPSVLRAVTYAGDVAGHGTLNRWQADESGLTLISTESTWQHGIPRRPDTAEEAALAAVEAALLERFEEAESYFIPGAQPSLPLESIPRSGKICMPMKYALPGSPAAVALLYPEVENLARIRPLYYRAERFHGEWRLAELSDEA